MIDAREEYVSMRKNLGSKRNLIPDETIDKLVNTYLEFKEDDNVKIFNNEYFGYTKITVERPMQLNYCVDDERIEKLCSSNQFKKLAESKNKDPEIKMEEEEKGEEKQKAIIKALKTIGNDIYYDWNDFEPIVKEVLSEFDLKPAFIKNVIEKLSEHDDTAEYVTDKKGKQRADTNLRDTEKIPLTQDIGEYLDEEVFKYYPNAWHDSKKDKIGYEINFTQYFYIYEPPRKLEEIDKDIYAITNKIQELLEE